MLTIETEAPPMAETNRKTLRVLNLGCGNRKFEFAEANRAAEVVGVDSSTNSQADIVHDLDRIPYPVESDSFDLIIMRDVIEHLDDLPAVMNEVYRIVRDGGIVRIQTPHYSSWYLYNDPTHKRFLGIFALDYFDADRMMNTNDPTYMLGTAARFRFLKRQLLFPKLWRVTGVAALANRFQHRWEQLFAFTFRAENMLFELQAVK
jgi:SAM-dependent methyltransferase